MANTYTVAELQELPDADLNALAATLGDYRHDPSNAAWYDEHGGRFDYEYEFKPATNRNQSGELLEWFVETQWKGHYAIRSGKLFRSVCVTAATDGDDVNVEVNGTGAKAETIAFCAAMLALAGRLQ